MSPSSPPQTTVMTSDEPRSSSVKSPLHNNPANSERTTPHSELTSSSLLLASPTLPVSTSSQGTGDTNASMSALRSRIQPSNTLQNMKTAPISVDSNISCLTPQPATSLRCDQPPRLSPQPYISGIADPYFVSTEAQQSITRRSYGLTIESASMTFPLLQGSFTFPGAATPATAHDHVFLDSANSCTLTSASSVESVSTTSEKMPNVYINGLPPNLSEQDLFALARQFGDIKSVRTFTRHVSEKPTFVPPFLVAGDSESDPLSDSRGYGFVLFYDVESAERCIEGLRKCRNLHPSFSKQVHRIPGTEYAQHSTAQSTDHDENTFKSRMERLKDAASTNLYIEGLPLSIDEETLAALMSPFKIKSSRCFKTKLSNPPRIIAFVRLETRAAAEEIIERLHGRMVRGWNDPGCRISVRFADSAEQRELRRAERTLKNGDQSPSRLTIAQAALLNLHGQELQVNIHDAIGGKPQRVVTQRSGNPAATFTPSSDSDLFPTSRSLPSNLRYPFKKSPLLPTSELPFTSEMDHLLQSVQNMGCDDGSLDSTIRNSVLDNEYLVAQQAQFRALASAALLSRNPLPITLPRGHAQARNGFTPAEELVLETHAQRLQLQPQLTPTPSVFESTSSLRKFNSNVRTSREPLIASGLTARPMFSQETLPTISEDDFHAMGHHEFVPASREFQVPSDNCPNVPTTASTIFVRPANRAVSIVAPPPDYEEPGKRPKGNHQRTERPVGSKQATYSSFNHRQSIPLSENKSHSVLAHTSTSLNDISSKGNENNNNNNTISRDKNELQHTYMYSHGNAQGYGDEERVPHLRSAPASQMYAKKSSHPGGQHSAAREGPKSPAVVSPALTYSSRTPSTLSPATPFFGSFASGQDTFEVMTMENEEVAERKLRARVVHK